MIILEYIPHPFDADAPGSCAIEFTEKGDGSAVESYLRYIDATFYRSRIPNNKFQKGEDKIYISKIPDREPIRSFLDLVDFMREVEKAILESRARSSCASGGIDFLGR